MKSLQAAIAAIALATAGGAMPAALAQEREDRLPRAKVAPQRAVEVGVEEVRAQLKAQRVQDENLRILRVRAAQTFREQHLQNYEQMLRPLVYAEYHRVRVLFGLDREQRKRIAGDVPGVITEAASRAYDSYRGGTLPVGVPVNQTLNRQVEDAMIRVVETRLGGEQARLYGQELARRAEENRQAAVGAIIAELDQELCLSSRQRDELRSVLSARWTETWSSALDGTGVVTRTLFPSLSAHVVPLLSDAQRSAWILRTRGAATATRRLALAVPANATPLEDDELLEARAAAVQAGPRPGDAPQAPARRVP